jgi:hypothetical protein
VASEFSVPVATPKVKRAVSAALLLCSNRLSGDERSNVLMVQKITEVVGTSKRSFAEAAENAVSEAAKTLRGMKWARVSELEMGLEGKKVTEYRTTVRIYFDVER